MRNRLTVTSSLRATGLVGAALLASCLLPSVSAASTISTVEAFTGEQLADFGDPNTATYGQTITVPAGETSLKNFTFYLREPTGLHFQAYVYAWEGGHATGPALYVGPEMHTTEEGVDQPITANTGGVPVTPEKQYVLFFSIANDRATDGGTHLAGSWGWVAGNPYAGGQVTWQNNAYDPSQWTNPTEAEEEEEPGVISRFPDRWEGPSTADLEFSATFGKSPVVSAVTPSVASPGTQVKITGEHLGGATNVLFGGVAAPSFTAVSETEVLAVVPPGVSGTMDVTVVTEYGPSAPGAGDRVTVPVPTLAPAPLTPAAVVHPILRCVVPFMRGLTKSEVKQALKAAGCKLGRVARHYNRIRKGGLVEQKLHQTTIRPYEAEVGVWLSLGAHKRHRHHHRHA